MSAPRVLVADDDAMARLGYRALLENAGYPVLMAEDGDEATRLIEKGGVDILMLDILMPRKEGLETLLEVKRRFPDMPVVVMSAGGTRGSFDFLTLATRLGADRTLSKPFRPQELVALLQDLMQARRT
jgi:CheY-like chemotaxis protein